MVFDLPHCHTTGVKADDHVIQPVQTALALTDQPGGERARPVTRNVDGERANLGLDCLRGRPITGIRAFGGRVLALLVPDMARHLRLQTPLQRGLQKRRQQSIEAGDRNFSGVDLGEQFIQRSAGLKLGNELDTRR